MDIQSLTIHLESSLKGKGENDLHKVILTVGADEDDISMKIEFFTQKGSYDERLGICLDQTPDTENKLANTFMFYATLLRVKQIKLEYTYDDEDAKDVQQTFTLAGLLEELVEDKKISQACICKDEDKDDCECGGGIETWDWDKGALYRYFRDEILEGIQFRLFETHMHKKNLLKIKFANCPITQEPITLPCIQLLCGHLISREAWPAFKKSFANDCCKRACPLCREKFGHSDWVSLA